MSYTLLKKTVRGIVLLEYHLDRLGIKPGDETYSQFVSFARNSQPGLWRVEVMGEWQLVTRPVDKSRLFDGIPFRLKPSPLTGGPMPKAAPPSVFERVRKPGQVSLLYHHISLELLEACCASVVSLHKDKLLLVPALRPRVISMSESAIREHLPYEETMLSPFSSEPLLLINAAMGTCSLAPGIRAEFPRENRQKIEDLFNKLTAMP